MGELAGDDPGGRGVVGHEVFKRLVGENDAPAEGYAARVALEHVHVMGGVAQLHRDREIEPGRPTADAGDFHFTRSMKSSTAALKSPGRSMLDK
jgi:hypothetical protein